MEKQWYQSKKFIAFLITEVLLAGLAVAALLSQDSLGWPLSGFMIAIVLSIGAVAFGFNGQQAALDKYLRGMSMQPFAHNPFEGAPVITDRNESSR